MKTHMIRFSEWAQTNWLALIIFMVLAMLFFLFVVMISWLYGYWSNAINGTHFELASCWSGVTVVITGLGGVAALAGAGWSKYHIDSKYNTAMGEMPRQSGLYKGKE